MQITKDEHLDQWLSKLWEVNLAILSLTKELSECLVSELIECCSHCNESENVANDRPLVTLDGASDGQT